jgi:hypothetical protein
MGYLKELKKQLEFSDLCKLAQSKGTDKCDHGYTKIYNEIMKDRKYECISFFEIGIFRGNSIRLWHDYFPNGKVFGIDNGRIITNTPIKAGPSNENPSDDDIRLSVKNSIIDNYNFNWLENDRIKCYIADQRSETQISDAFKYFECEQYDYILDDGQHYQEHQQTSLAMMFKNIKSGGYYIIEDLIDINKLLRGEFWGQSKQDCTDSTHYVFNKYIETGILESEYMTKDEIKYITDNISDICLYEPSNSSLNNGMLLIIKKK